MSLYRWPDRRRAAAPILALISLALAASLFAACGLFGDDEEIPDVVPPPQSTAQSQQSDTPLGQTTTGAEQQQQEQSAQAVRVTTSPDDDTQQQEEPLETVEDEQDDADPTVYIVQPGDTLAAIANRLGVRLDDLITLNGIQNPDQISVGQELRIPSSQPTVANEASEEQAEQEGQQQSQEDEEEIEPPSVELPTVAVPAATPTQVSYTQFPQPGPEQTTDTIPDPPTNFLQYGAAALPWLHGIAEVEPIIELFKAWPMPALAVGNDRVVLVDTSGTGNFTVSIVYTDPNSFGAAVPYSNLVVYDPVPGNVSRYRIAYDHAQAYAREVQGIQQLSDWDLTRDDIRDLTFRELTCDEIGCVSSFYILAATGDGYRTITGPAAQVAQVASITIEDRTGDGGLDIVVEGLATDEAVPSRYTFVFTAQGDELVEALRVSASGGEDASEEDSDSLGE